MANKQRGCQNKEVLERMNFLYQAADLLAGKNDVLSCYYGNMCKSVAKKAVVRMWVHSPYVNLHFQNIFFLISGNQILNEPFAKSVASFWSQVKPHPYKLPTTSARFSARNVTAKRVSKSVRTTNFGWTIQNQ